MTAQQEQRGLDVGDLINVDPIEAALAPDRCVGYCPKLGPSLGIGCVQRYQAALVRAWGAPRLHWLGRLFTPAGATVDAASIVDVYD